MFLTRSNKTQEEILVEKLLDLLGRCLRDVDDFCCFCQSKKYPFDNRKSTHLDCFV